MSLSSALLKQDWVILFGGPRREPVVMSLLATGMTVRAIIVPEVQTPALRKSVDALRSQNVPIITTRKADIDTTLLPFAGHAMFSVGFPFLLPVSVLERHSLRLNVHPTLLPVYRGPMSGYYIPVNNEKESGSTVHFLEAGMDDGDIIIQNRVPISKFDTVRSIQRKVYEHEPALVVEALKKLDAGEPATKQDETQATIFQKMRTPADSEIDPNKPLIELFDMIRACDPDAYPAFFYMEGQKVCIRLWRPDRPPEDKDDMI